MGFHPERQLPGMHPGERPRPKISGRLNSDEIIDSAVRIAYIRQFIRTLDKTKLRSPFPSR